MRGPPLTRLLAKIRVDPATGCWLWTGAINRLGYGSFWLDGRTMPAHRAAVILYRGPIPTGLEPDHVCRVRACVRPELPHIELVTHAVNVARGVPRCSKITHCVGGHELAPIAGRGPRPRCRLCHASRMRAWRAARVGAAG